jgi:hypothetical protein
MATPELPAMTAQGLLPEGVYPCTIEIVQDRFGWFQRSDRRITLFHRLRAYFNELRATGWDFALIVDGSFVMSCVDDPGDIDLVLIMPADWDQSAEVLPHEYNLLSKKRIKKLYGMDVYVVLAGSAEESRWTEFFQQVNVKWSTELGLPLGLKKGVLRIGR